MPLVNEPVNPPAVPLDAIEEVLPNIVAPEFKGSVVDSKVYPVSALLSHVEGSSWVVDYYSQLLGSNEELVGPQANQLGAYQQYRLIQKFEFKVTSPLSQQQDPESTTFKVTGGATIYSGLIPNVGDTFLADVGDGRTGQFNITASNRINVLEQSVYTVEYILLHYMTEQSQYDALQSKVVDTLTFVKGYLTYGKNPMIEQSSLSNVQSLVKYKSSLLTRYLNNFFSPAFQTL